jgi:hypothetical protein
MSRSYYFDRLCRVLIESEKAIDITENKIKFELTKSSNPRENVARVQIWNLSLETRQQITASDSLVRLFAGYEQFKGLLEIGQGDITNVQHKRNMTDTVTNIFIAEGYNVLRTKPVSFSFKGIVQLSDILYKITELTGVGFTLINIQDNASIQGSYSDEGGLDVVLHDLALVFHFTWSMQSGVIILKGRKIVNGTEVMLLTPETGLILNPESVKKISVKLVDSDDPLPPNTYAVQSLLQPHLQVYDSIVLKSPHLNGSFQIIKISHTGDTRGNEWYSNMEVVAV